MTRPRPRASGAQPRRSVAGLQLGGESVAEGGTVAGMRRLLRAASVLVGLVALVLGASYWSQPDLDVVAAGQKTLGIELRSAMLPTNGINLHVVDASCRGAKRYR